MRTIFSVKHLNVASVAFALVLISGISQAATFNVSAIHFEQNQPPQDIGDITEQMRKQNIDRQMIMAASAYFLIPSQAIASAKAVPHQNYDPDSEKNRINYIAQPGYVFCTAHIQANGKSGSGALHLVAKKEYLQVYTWLKKLRPGQGKSYVNADITFVTVKADQYERYLAANRCAAHDKSNRFGRPFTGLNW